MKIFITFYFNQDIIELTIAIVITIFKKEG